MDECLTKMKETTDLLEDAGVSLPHDVVVWYTLKNLLKEYDIVKQMILCNFLPTYTKMELRLLSEEMSRKIQKRDKKESEALVATQSSSCKTFDKNQNPQNRFGLQGYQHSGLGNNGFSGSNRQSGTSTQFNGASNQRYGSNTKATRRSPIIISKSLISQRTRISRTT